jgi:PEP-CTERM motif
MKKVLLVLGLFGLGTMAQASFIQCLPNQDTVVNNASGASATFTCSPAAGADVGTSDDNVAGDGVNVISLRLRVSGTFQENHGAVGQGFSVQFGSTNNLGSLSPGTPGCLASATADNNGQALGACVSTSAFLSGLNQDVVPQFTVTVSGGPGSNPLPFNASASVFYEVTTQSPPPPPGIPEPTTYALLATGLFGFYAIRRRR